MKNKITLLLSIVFFSSCAQPPAPKLGLTMHGDDFKLETCHGKTSCISSFEPKTSKSYTPQIKIHGDEDKMIQTVLEYLKKTPGFKVTAFETDYIRATFTSFVFKFIDDIEFYFPGDNTLQIRSASRTGKFDFGKNRERIETIRFKYIQRSL